MFRPIFPFFIVAISSFFVLTARAEQKGNQSDKPMDEVRWSPINKTANAQGLVSLKGADGQSDLAASSPAIAQVKPYRTFIEVARYNMENNGESNNPISNVRIVVTFPNQQKIQLPEGGQWWPIGNGQAQEIHKFYELPFSYIQNDGFKFSIQMERKGSLMLPCNFEVITLSQFNRSYTCHTDLNWQQNERISPENFDKEGIQVRVFTDQNSEKKEIPGNALMIR